MHETKNRHINSIPYHYIHSIAECILHIWNASFGCVNRKPFITYNVHTFSKFMVFWFFQIKTNWNVVKFIKPSSKFYGTSHYRHQRCGMILHFSCFRSHLDSYTLVNATTIYLCMEYIAMNLLFISCIQFTVQSLFGSYSSIRESFDSIRHFFSTFLLVSFLFLFHWCILLV